MFAIQQHYYKNFKWKTLNSEQCNKSLLITFRKTIFITSYH